MKSTEVKLQRGDTLLIGFSDRGMTFAHVMATDGIQARIKVDAYRTQRGTHIGSKIWIVQPIDPVYDLPCYQVRIFSPEKKAPWKSSSRKSSGQLPPRRK
jgi:hypothetical protein